MAAVTLGLVGLTGCELFDQTVGKALGWSTEQVDTGLQQGEIYGAPPSDEPTIRDEPLEPDVEEPSNIYGDPATMEEPADIYGSPSMMDEPTAPPKAAEPTEPPDMRDQPLYGVP